MKQALDPNRSAGPFSCLVIQLAGEGDVYQSLMALKAAKHLYPQIEVTFLVLEKHAQAVKKTAWLKNVVAFPESEIIDPILACQTTEKEALRKLAHFVAPLIREPWDLVVNWSFSEASSYLSALLPAPKRIGYTRRTDGTQVCADQWSQYFQGVVQTNEGQNIHVTDILTTQLLTALHQELGNPADVGQLPVSSRSFFAVEYEASDLEPFRAFQGTWIGLQISTEQAGEGMTSDDWARLGSFILRRHPEAKLILFGGEGDQSRARSMIEKLSHELDDRSRVISLVGDTRFEKKVQALIRCRWVISFDSALAHLASILGTRVLYLCHEANAPIAKVLESAPYGNGHVIVNEHKKEPEFLPEAAYAAWSYFNAEYMGAISKTMAEHFEQLGWLQLHSRFTVLKARIRHVDDGGGVVYESLEQEPMTFAQWQAALLGQCARAWYCGWTPPVANEVKKERLSPALILEVRKLEEAVKLLQKVCEESERTAQALYQKASLLPSAKIMDVATRQEIDQMARKLNELEELMVRLAHAQTALKVFPIMQKVIMHNLEGHSIAELALESAESYHQLSRGVSVYQDWITYTLQQARPTAVKNLGLVKPTPADRGIYD